MLTADQVIELSRPSGCPASWAPVLHQRSEAHAIVDDAMWERLEAGRRSLHDRMVAAMAKRHGWTDAQRAAARVALHHLPVHFARGGKMRGADPMPVMTEAARLAASDAPVQDWPGLAVLDYAEQGIKGGEWPPGEGA